MFPKRIIRLTGKEEVVGNLISVSMGPKGVAKFSFGEYFEASPLCELIKPDKILVKNHLWEMGSIRRQVEVDGITLNELLAAYEDTLVYSISNPEHRTVELHLKGSISVFSWFNSQLRSKIRRLAGVKFEPLEELSGFAAFYGDTSCLCVSSSESLKLKIEEDQIFYEIEAKLRDGETLAISAAGSTSLDEAIINAKKALKNPEKLASCKLRELEVSLSRTPRLTGLKPRYKLLWNYLWYTILSNRVKVKGHPVLKFAFNMPSKHVFRHQWLWDSAFHAIVLSRYDVRMAEEELRNLFLAQKSDGRIPHEVFISKEFCSLFWEVDDFAPWTTQPPVIALSVDYIRKNGGNRGFLEEAFKVLDRYDVWFRKFRDADKDQLMTYVDYLESGWDNSVRWDNAINKFKENPEKYEKLYHRLRMAPIEAVDLNCLIYLQRLILKSLALELDYKDKAEEYAELAERTALGIRNLMWNPKDGFYYDIYEEDHTQLGIKTPAAFLTLFAGLPDKEQAEALVHHLMDPEEFWTTFPLPSVSADDPSYDPKGYWRGRSWINLAWFSYQGLKRYGFEDEAKTLARRILKIMAKGPTCNENYDSSTGEPLGAPDFGWSTLALDFFKELDSNS